MRDIRSSSTPSHPRRALTIGVGLFLALTAVLATGLAAQSFGGSAGLFSDESPANARTPDGAWAVRSRSATVNTVAVETAADGWEQSDGETGSTLNLNLFSDVVVTASIDTVERQLPGTVTWVGRVAGIEGSHVVLTVAGGEMAGFVDLAGSQYEIRSDGAGGHLIDEVASDAGLPMGEPLAPQRSKAEPLAKAGSSDDGTVIDILYVYTPAARDLYGGARGIENRVASSVAYSNSVFAASGILPRLRLVGVELTQYSASGSLPTDLGRLRSTSDGYMDEVHALRDARGADLVQLVVSHGDYGGYAYIMPGSNNPGFESSAFSVIRQFFIATHEIGHNLGCNHAPEDPTGIGAFSYSFGYKDPPLFRTLMAYPCTGCTLVNLFSSPLGSYQGRPTGTAGQDNVRSINNVRTVVANFRQSVPGVCPWSVGHPRYCEDCGPCGIGEADCDGDSECEAGLVCAHNVGAEYGYPANFDVCELPCPWPEGHPSYCRDCGPCGEGQGDCDGAGQCEAGLVCRDDIGPAYGFGANVDVCEAPCPVAVGHPDYCTLCGPCAPGEGDCDGGQCLTGNVCSPNVGALYGFGAGIDVCEAAPSTLLLTPTADAWVAQAYPNANYGGGQELRVRWTGTGVGHHSFLKFEVPAGLGTILSATLRLRTQETVVGEAGFYDADIAPWSEYGITFANWGTVSQATHLRSLTNLAPNSWHEVDVSEAVTGAGTVTIGIASGTNSPNQDFWSRESSWDPQLVISYRP